MKTVSKLSSSFSSENCIEIVEDQRGLCLCNSKVAVHGCDPIVDRLEVALAVVLVGLLGFEMHGDRCLVKCSVCICVSLVFLSVFLLVFLLVSPLPRVRYSALPGF